MLLFFMLAILCTGLISYCSVPLELLGPLLIEIVVAHSFWVTRFPDIIANIFTYLIVTNQLVHNCLNVCLLFSLTTAYFITLKSLC